MTDSAPKLTRVYQNHHLDSTRWQLVEPRDGDIVVTTSYKSGTTWTQAILNALLHHGQDPLPSLRDVSPWVDARFHGSREALAEECEKLEGRRFLKSHLPFDGLPYWPEARYLVVCRDPRDVFMSLANHYGAYTDFAYAVFNGGDDLVGDPLPPCPDDVHVLWRDWMTRGWFEWESEGYPLWSNLHHTATYWPHRHLPNVMLLHYNDMLVDLEAAVRDVADFCDIPVDDDLVARVAERTTFANMKKTAIEMESKGPDMPEIFRGGQKTFFHKGKNGRWRDVLTDEDLALYEAAKKRVLEPECARWLEEGGPVS